MNARDLYAIARRRRALRALRRVHAAVATDLTQPSRPNATPQPRRRSHPRSEPPQRVA